MFMISVGYSNIARCPTLLMHYYFRCVILIQFNQNVSKIFFQSIVKKNTTNHNTRKIIACTIYL